MSRVRLTPAAQRDLSEIWDFAQDRRDVRQAELNVGELRAAIERVADDPARGRACEDVRQGHRRSSIGSHVVFSRPSSDGVDVIRILHQRMDATRDV